MNESVPAATPHHFSPSAAAVASLSMITCRPRTSPTASRQGEVAPRRRLLEVQGLARTQVQGTGRREPGGEQLLAVDARLRDGVADERVEALEDDWRRLVAAQGGLGRAAGGPRRGADADG